MSSQSPAAVHSDPTRHAIKLWVREDVRDLIDQAAKGQGRSRSDFMIEAARRAAEESLLDRTLVRVDRQTYEHFLAVLVAARERALDGAALREPLENAAGLGRARRHPWSGTGRYHGVVAARNSGGRRPGRWFLCGAGDPARGVRFAA